MAPTTTAKPSQKRKADTMTPDSDADVVLPATKKTSITKPSTKKTFNSKAPIYTTAELSTLSYADLLAHAILLNEQLATVKASSPATKERSPEDIAKKMQHLQSLMEKQIRKAMVWKPSCKTGSATFSQEFVVQSEQVIKDLFKCAVKEGGKGWKMKKFGAEEFQEDVVQEEIRASTRYDYLVLTSDVTVRWDAENGTMKCSGKYGKIGTGRAALTSTDGEE